MKPLPNDARTCYKCDYETSEPLAKCPQCGRPLRTGRQVRRLGWLLTFIGAFLVAMMSVLSYVIAGINWQTDAPGSSARFTGWA